MKTATTNYRGLGRKSPSRPENETRTPEGIVGQVSHKRTNREPLVLDLLSVPLVNTHDLMDIPVPAGGHVSQRESAINPEVHRKKQTSHSGKDEERVLSLLAYLELKKVRSPWTGITTLVMRPW